MPTGKQIRAARALADWSGDDLAGRVGLSRESIQAIERGSKKPRTSTEEKIVAAFHDMGIEFIEGEGVRKRREDIVTYTGVEGFIEFQDDLYHEAMKPEASLDGSRPICAIIADDKDFVILHGSNLANHIRRMSSIKNFKMRIIVGKKPEAVLKSKLEDYREYRMRDQSDATNVPFYVYGDKLAMLIFDVDNPPHIYVINSTIIARAYREQFSMLWRSAVPLAAREKQ